jgi:hypothetical protein
VSSVLAQYPSANYKPKPHDIKLLGLRVAERPMPTGPTTLHPTLKQDMWLIPLRMDLITAEYITESQRRTGVGAAYFDGDLDAEHTLVTHVVVGDEMPSIEDFLRGRQADADYEKRLRNLRKAKPGKKKPTVK